MIFANRAYLRSSGRGGFPHVESDRARLGRGPDHHEGPAPDAAGHGAHDSEAERGGDGGVDGVAAFFEHGDADFGATAIVGCNHRLL